MSAAAAAVPPAEEGAVAPAKKGKKKLIIIAAAALLVLAVIGGGTVVFLKKRAAHAAEALDAAGAKADEHHSTKPDLKHPPTFLPLDPFVVNLSDKDADRYAQIGITLEVEDAKFADAMKAFMPAIRNGILMILSHKTSRELLDRAGKEQLAAEILRESSRTMGIDVDEPAAAPELAAEKAAEAPKDKAADGAEEIKPNPKPKAKEAAEPNPIRRVHFANFIVQ